METLLLLALFIIPLLGIGVNLLVYLKFFQCIEAELNYFKEKYEEIKGSIDEIEFKSIKMSGQLDRIQEEIHRSMLAHEKPLEAAKPIKPNNWDSMKEAFKGPTRIEANERN